MSEPHLEDTGAQIVLGQTVRTFVVAGLVGAVLFPVLFWAKLGGFGVELETPAKIAAVASAALCLGMAAYAPHASRKSMFVFDFQRRVVKNGRGKTWLFSSLECLRLRQEPMLQNTVFLELILRNGQGVSLYAVPAYEYDSLKNLGTLLASRLQLQLEVPR